MDRRILALSTSTSLAAAYAAAFVDGFTNFFVASPFAGGTKLERAVFGTNAL